MDRSGKSFGAPALSYISEKRAERHLGRSIDLGKETQSMTWGKVAEYYCNKYHLDIFTELHSGETTIHKDYSFWSGSPDFTKEDTAGEIKCYEPKGFFELSYAMMQVNSGGKTLDEFKKEFEKEYWQVTSNAIIKGYSKCSLVAYMPTVEQLEEIRSDVEETNILEDIGVDIWAGRFISESYLYKLPFVANKDYPNFVKLDFDLVKEDAELLTKLVIKAESLI